MDDLRPDIRQMSSFTSNRGLALQRPSCSVEAADFPKRPKSCKLSQEIWDKVEKLFCLIDDDNSRFITREEARAFFKGAFAKMSADAMFSEVDIHQNGAITAQAFTDFWIQVKKSGYKDEEIT